MAVHKSKKDGRWDVFVYSPAAGRSVYVGRRQLQRDANTLFREKTGELAKAPAAKVTCAGYAKDWLEDRHGDGTKRPSESTRSHNGYMLRPFLDEFGDRLLRAGIGRREALRWARSHPSNAKAVSAMFNDALDDESCTENPFRNRQQTQPLGRQEIFPLTEDEVDRLAGIASDAWGAYGLMARAWVLFGAWVGSRPGETFAVQPRDLDFEGGLVRVTRVKGRKQTEWIVLPGAVQDAISRMPPARDTGPLFRTVTGLPMDRKGALHYHWSPIRAAFKATVTAERWAELLNGQSDKRSLDFYACRHFCASIIVDRGGNEYDVSAQLGNSPEVARKTYIHGYRDRVNDRNRQRLEGVPNVIDLGARRERSA